MPSSVGAFILSDILLTFLEGLFVEFLKGFLRDLEGFLRVLEGISHLHRPVPLLLLWPVPWRVLGGCSKGS